MTCTKEKLTREEIAKIEIGHTSISPAVALFLTLMFIVVIFSVPAVQHVFEIFNNQKNEENNRIFPYCYNIISLIPQPDEITAVVQSKSLPEAFGVVKRINARMLKGINEYENVLEDNAILSERIISHVGSILIGVLRAGNEEVYCGVDGWLFYRPGIDYLTGRGFLEPEVLTERARAGNEWQTSPQPDPVKAIVRFKNQLAGRGIDLIVLPAPAKAMVYPEKFSRHYNNITKVLQNPSYGEFKKKLESEGVKLFDAASVLASAIKDTDETLYLETDTHWSPAGMELVARALADYITKQGILSPSGSVQYERSTVTIKNQGDIATMLNLPGNQHFYQPQEVCIQQVSTGDNTLWKPRRTADVLFLGDSFANVFSLEGMGWGKAAGLVEQLSYELQRPIDTILINDNGSFASRRLLSRELQQGIDRLAGKKIVIYEFAVRELAVGDWKTGLDFTVGSSKKREPGTITQAGDLVITGMIKAVSRAPKPGTVPYKDCIVSISMTNVQPVTGVLEDSEILVYAWGMQDNKLQPASYYKPGKTMTLHLTSWEAVESEYGSYNRVEPDDDTFLRLNIYWAVAKEKKTVSGKPERVEPDKKSFVVARGKEQDGKTQTVKKTVDDLAREFLKDLAGKVAVLEKAGKNTFKGKDGWLFFVPELRSLSVGPFWGEAAANVSRASNPDYADPLPAILDFKAQLDTAGIELIVVPVPAKAIIYPEMVSNVIQCENGQVPERLDIYMKKFYSLLEEYGVHVLDLVPVFLPQRFSEKGDLFCRQDTHWSGHACELAAQIIAENICNQSWYEGILKKTYVTEAKTVQITGDLWNFLGDNTIAKEILPLTTVGEEGPDGVETVKRWRESPVMLLGDSHCLVFHAGTDMHARGAGLADHLAKELGFPVDLVAVRGSEAASRINLLRRGDNLPGKNSSSGVSACVNLPKVQVVGESFL